YLYQSTPGSTIINKKKELFSYLDESEIKDQLLDFTNGELSKVTFKISNIHCSSCIWLLENLFKLKKGISQSRVNFLKKEVSITFFNHEVSLRELVEFLSSLGYEPNLQLDSQGNTEDRDPARSNSYSRIGVAGFCFGNIMFFSFPEYFAFGKAIRPDIKHFFELLNFIFSIPVFFYCSSVYYISAYKGLKQNIINMDVPITLGIITLFVRSVIDLFVQSGPGYFDSLSGLVFFLLVGKMFQQKTFDSLSFDRDYQSYFPLSITLSTENGERTIPVKNLKKGDRISIRNGELIPVDSQLLSEKCEVDYSFVTGESTPVFKKKGELIFAGGRLIGKVVNFKVLKGVSQSYLTSLWNNEVFRKEQATSLSSLSNSIAKYFTPLIIFLALAAGLYWGITDWHKGLNVLSAVLIVACPCALALSTPFTLGTTLRIFGKNGFYLKEASVVENLSKLDTVVFDKTGTLTHSGSFKIEFNGNLTDDETEWARTLARQSTHPLSQSIYHFLESKRVAETEMVEEITGKGIHGVVGGHEIYLGKLSWLQSLGLNQKRVSVENHPKTLATTVHLAIDGSYSGYFSLTSNYRNGLSSLFNQLKEKYRLVLLSGDQDQEKEKLATLFKSGNDLHFDQTPEDKLNCISGLSRSGAQTLMIGDGLNDAGALKGSKVGIAISEDLTAFSPACDGILGSESFTKLESFLALSRYSRGIIITSFVLSIFYNIIGLGFAVQGHLSPLVSAILMPVSSTSVVLFTTGAVYLTAKRLRL
ncbi:MAG: heavy metal translocating P-type ATPase, partial [Proteobacteria bacterium]|nr:heavy metal translocating P-type ATPase [Pseudomonadota bacterium]